MRTTGASAATRVRRPLVVLGAVALTGAGLTAGTAAADTTSTAYTDDGGHAVYYTSGDVHSSATITEGPNPGTEFVIDDVVPIAAGDGCVHPDAADTTRVLCTLTEFGDFWTRVIVDLGDGHDSLVIDAGDENAVHGGAGSDNIRATGGTMIWGEEGDDWLTGGMQYGGPGDDGLNNASSAHGDDGDDYIWGNDRSSSFYGGRGNDEIHGNGGADTIFGNSGEDLILGGKGHDDLYGGPDADVLYGNSGDDLLHGGPATDQLSGGPGADDVHED
ncbi:hypothetical protein [Streptomyces sp. B6B3]|uniref:calcium-binding protein n=1 Tax=Streptomyces sp. B6B3 TaxID=3153570 RepID=UPI00325F11B8